MSVTAPTFPPTYTVGTAAHLEADLTDIIGNPEESGDLHWLVRDPAGAEEDRSTDVQNPSTGKYTLDVVADATGDWYWKVSSVSGVVVVTDGWFRVIDDYSIVGDPTQPTDLRVLVPRTRRYCEGPFPSPDRPRLVDTQIYEMVADACGDIILLSGDLFGRKLIVTQRDGRTGFPIAWATDQTLEEWESALITSQAALNFFFHEFRDKKVSENMANEGQTWEWQISATVLKAQFDLLKDTRDRALLSLKQWHPTMARFASVIAVRDRQTSAILEWWARSNPGQIGNALGIGGGQEASVVPAFYPPGP